MADFSGTSYGIAANKNTTPNVPPPVRMNNPPSISDQMNERRIKYGSVNVGGSYVGSAGTPMRPTTPSPSVVASRIPTAGTPLRPVPEKRTDPLVYFGGTPTSETGYISRLEYFGGTPTSPAGYNPPPLTPENDPSRFDEEKRRRAEEEAAKKAAEAERLRKLEGLLSQLGALQPEQQMAYRQAVRNAEREFEMMRNQIQTARKGVRRDYRQGVRDVTREQTGQSTDLAEALAFLGMDTSPATMGVGLQDLEIQADIARAELARMKAASMGDLDMQMTQARIGRRRAISAAEQAKLQAQAQQRREQINARLGMYL